MTRDDATAEQLGLRNRPDSLGRFGKFGGKYVPETLMYALSELESAFRFLSKDPQFQVCFVNFLSFFLFLVIVFV